VQLLSAIEWLQLLRNRFYPNRSDRINPSDNAIGTNRATAADHGGPSDASRAAAAGEG
jgi:hypothetical protein